ncbi:MAG: BLUF domain-containing protein [Ottowia sp.]|uniref:BLUF domain-containing protein n=1 Tax=Ottowia sp. TaxID=1898956 RepID=UPI0039E3FCDE
MSFDVCNGHAALYSRLSHSTIAAEELHLYEFLYCSTLAEGQSPTVVGQILARARPHNAAHGITGLLVFDGQHFCQHLEGPRAPLEALMARIAGDPRHTGVCICHEGPLAERRYQRFDMGYAQAEGTEEIEALFTLRDAAALARFLALRPDFDVHGG